MQSTIFFILLVQIICHRVKITIHPNYTHHQEALFQVAHSFFEKGQLLFKGSRNSIKKDFLGDEEINIKFFQKPGLVKSIIYSFFKDSKAKRSFDYATYLIDHKLLTPFPIAYIEERNALGLLGKSYYICQHINYDFTFRELIHQPLFPDRNEILEQFTEFTFKLHEAKINFLDHSPGNTLIIKKADKKYDFYLIDLNRMKFESLSIAQRMDNFKKLWLSKRMIQIIAKKYAALAQHPEQEIERLLMQFSTQFKRKAARKKYIKKFVGKNKSSKSAT